MYSIVSYDIAEEAYSTTNSLGFASGYVGNYFLKLWKIVHVYWTIPIMPFSFLEVPTFRGVDVLYNILRNLRGKIIF
jgi:hypothetical protein